MTKAIELDDAALDQTVGAGHDGEYRYVPVRRFSEMANGAGLFAIPEVEDEVVLSGADAGNAGPARKTAGAGA